MGKIFTIQFQYINHSHNALVSVYKKENNYCYHIQFIDNYLKTVFSTEHIRYHGDDGFRKLEWYENPFTRTMLNKMAVAIERNLKSQYAMIKWLFPVIK